MVGTSSTPQTTFLSNVAIADRLGELADLLEGRNANPFRARAYRNAAMTIRELRFPVGELLKEGHEEELVELPGIGNSLAETIRQLATTGRLPLLDQLRGKSREAAVLETVPGVGPKTAALIHEKLGIETLEQLEAAANDGRLDALPGIGQKRLRAVRESLAGRFQSSPRFPRALAPAALEPPVADLLSIDEEYRHKASLGRLPEVSPRRFNPARTIWLPILRTHRGGKRFTAMFSNTALAHKLQTTRDWVIIIGPKGTGGPWTVVTGHQGPTKSRRVIRGREPQCAAYYAEQAAPVH